MKNIKIIICSSLLLFAACNDDFLEKLPKDQLTEASTFTTSANFETYAWGFYNTFPGYWDVVGIIRKDMASDLMVDNSGTQGHRHFVAKLRTVPSSSDTWN